MNIFKNVYMKFYFRDERIKFRITITNCDVIKENNELLVAIPWFLSSEFTD